METIEMPALNSLGKQEGAQLIKLLKAYYSNGLPTDTTTHESIKFIFEDSSGDVFLANEDEQLFACNEDEKLQEYYILPNSSEGGFLEELAREVELGRITDNEDREMVKELIKSKEEYPS